MDIHEGFEFLGFTKVKAKSLKKIVEKNPYLNHQTTAEWARYHIKQE